jgi:P27 family predicted phage terminase small subunit
MGAPIVPTKLKLLRGNPSRVPIQPEPEPRAFGSIPEPPDHLDAEAAAEWRKLAPELVRIGLLTLADVTGFGAYCQLVGRWIKAERALNGQELVIATEDGTSTKVNPLVHVASAAARDLLSAAAQFGMTPAGRARLNAGITRPPKKFSGLVAS